MKRGIEYYRWRTRVLKHQLENFEVEYQKILALDSVGTVVAALLSSHVVCGEMLGGFHLLYGQTLPTRGKVLVIRLQGDEGPDQLKDQVQSAFPKVSITGVIYRSKRGLKLKVFGK